MQSLNIIDEGFDISNNVEDGFIMYKQKVVLECMNRIKNRIKNKVKRNKCKIEHKHTRLISLVMKMQPRVSINKKK